MSPQATFIRAARRRPNALRRAWLHLKRAALAWDISSTQQYLAAAERDGIMNTATVRHWRSYLQERRTRLMVLDAQLRGEVAA